MSEEMSSRSLVLIYSIAQGAIVGIAKSLLTDERIQTALMGGTASALCSAFGAIAGVKVGEAITNNHMSGYVFGGLGGCILGTAGGIVLNMKF